MSAGRGLQTNYDAFLPASAPSPTASAAEDAPEGVLAWAARHRRIDGRPFTLERFGPVAALYADAHPHICVMKPAQRGVSEWAINAACFALELGAAQWAGGAKDGLNVAYLFPTQAALLDFSKERISGLRDESRHLARLFGGPDTFAGITFKQVGQSYLYLRGAWSESSLLSFPCDVLILDEYDRMNPRAVALARRRLNASLVRREIDISTPTIPGRGVDALYRESDQHAYEQPCPRCNAWVRYDFHRDVRVDGQDYGTWKDWPAGSVRAAAVALHCPQCRAAVGDEGRCAPGRWVADAPAVKNLRGYHIPALPFPMTDLGRLAANAVNPDPGEQAEFWRSDLGLPYDAAGARLTPAAILALAADGAIPVAGPWLNTTLGIDVGARFHYRVSATHAPTGRRVVRALGACRAWTDLTALMTRFQVRRCVIDALPELHACRDWAARFPGRVYRATYPQAVAVSARLYALNEAEGTVQINRTMALDSVYAAIADGEEHWPPAAVREPEVLAHLTAPVRVVTKDGTGQDRATWENTGPDHYFHACAYDRVAHAALIEHPAAGKAPVFSQGAAVGWGARARTH